MAEAPAEKRVRSRIARHWGTATLLALALTGFLGWYDAVRNQGLLFVCDVMALVGQNEAIAICREGGPPDESDQLALLEYLKAREDRLIPNCDEQDSLQFVKRSNATQAFLAWLRARRRACQPAMSSTQCRLVLPPSPPAQIPACAADAAGSCLGWLTWKR